MADADPVLLGADPPAHTRPRRAVARALSERRLSALEPEIRALAGGLVERLFARGGGDLVADFAKPLPVAVMGRLLGFDAVPLPDPMRWSDAVVFAGTGLGRGSASDDVAGDLAELDRALVALVERHGHSRETGLIGSMLDGPEGLTTAEAVSVVRLLLVAGNETTTHLIGSALLSQFAGGVASLAAVPDVTILERVLRTRPPVARVYRLANRSARTVSQSLAPGTVVAANLAAANRAHQRTVAETRAADLISSLAFGAGPHRCPGARLALIEAEAGLAAIRPRLSELNLQVHPQDMPMLASDRLSGPTRLPVTVAVGASGTGSSASDIRCLETAPTATISLSPSNHTRRPGPTLLRPVGLAGCEITRETFSGRSTPVTRKVIVPPGSYPGNVRSQDQHLPSRSHVSMAHLPLPSLDTFRRNAA